MCLRIYDKVELNFDSDGWVTCYKVYTLYEDGLESLYKSSPVTVFPVVSDRHSRYLTYYERMTSKIENGIHVFINEADAEMDICPCPYYNDVLIPVRCHKDDLVAVGYFDEVESAVFYKVHL